MLEAVIVEADSTCSYHFNAQIYEFSNIKLYKWAARGGVCQRFVGFKIGLGLKRNRA
jgi:hypothetical protein